MAVDRRCFLGGVVGLAAATAAGRASFGQTAGSLRENADAALREAVERGDIPGVAATVGDRHEILYEGAFGARAIGQAAPFTVDTVGLIASMTKPITATAAMRLVEQGRIELDAPADRWVPEIDKLEVLDGWTAEGAPRTRPPSRPITLRHLLTHTAGLGYGLWDAELARYNEVAGVPSVLSGDDAALRPALMFDPGTRWQYGISLDWVAKIVEEVSGQSLGAYMREHIFDPLGMESTGYEITPDMRARLAKVHQREEDGSLTPTDIERRQDPPVEMGGGGLYSTAPDYLKFVRMMLNDGTLDGERVLASETVGLMSRNAMGDIRVAKLETEAPRFSADAEFFPGLPKGWGLSFMINEEEAPTGRQAGSLAWAGIANTYFWIDRRTGIGGVYVTQILPFVDERVLRSYYAFEEAAYRALG